MSRTARPHVSWGDRSDSSEQLDKLLAGLDELSENLPDLGVRREPISRVNSGSRGVTPVPRGVTPVFRGVTPERVIEGVPPRSESVPRVTPPVVAQPRGVGSGPNRSYEEDVDYALDRSELGSPLPRVHSPTRKVGVTPQVAVDNYKEYYTDPAKARGGVTMGQEPQPYHTRYDSKPFSYIRGNNGQPPFSRPGSRNGSVGLDSQDGGRSRVGLESPSLLRRVMGGSSVGDDDTPPPSPGSPAFRRDSPAINKFAYDSPARSASPFNASPRRESNGSNNKSSFNNTSTEVNITFNNTTSGQSNYNNNSNGLSSSYNKSYSDSPFLSALNSTSSVLENSFSEINQMSSRNSEQPPESDAGLTWLQKQQKKLEERRESQKRQQQESCVLIKELKSSLQRARSGGTETTDGYASDVNSLLYSETSRESSPAKQIPIYNVPLQVETSQQQQQQQHNGSSFQNIQNMSSQNNMYSSVNKSSTLPAPSRDPPQSSAQYATPPAVNYRSSSASRAYDHNSSLSRNGSDASHDRGRPGMQRKRAESESEAELANLNGGNGYHQGYNTISSLRNNEIMNGSCRSIDSAGGMGGYSAPGSRSMTPAFPAMPSTPYFNHSSNTLPPKSPGTVPGVFTSRNNSRVDLTARAPSPAGSMYQGGDLTMSRRGSFSSEPADISSNNVKLVKDNYKFWYKPTITREEAIVLLKTQPPGTFVVRDSNSFPGAFGLALKVATPPANSNKTGGDPNSELVRHFLIEPTSKGVKLKGYSNEPVFASLSALVYQHTITALALPTQLVLPQQDLGDVGSSAENTTNAQMQQLLQLGAACNVHYLFTMETDQLTGSQAVKKTISQLFLTRPFPSPTVVHFKVSGQGITLTDQARKLFFRKHYSVSTISHCGMDPEDRRWSIRNQDGIPQGSNRLFGFVARKPTNRSCNQCHVFAELDPDQPARAIVNFVNKLMLSGTSSMSRSDIV